MNRNTAHNRNEFVSDVGVLSENAPTPEEEEEPPPQQVSSRQNRFKRLAVAMSDLSAARSRSSWAGQKTGAVMRTFPRQAFVFPVQGKKAPIPASRRSVVFRITQFPGASQDEWDDWQWQLS